MASKMRIPGIINDRSRNVVLAVLFGVVAAVLVAAYVHSYKHHVNLNGSQVQVLVASNDIQPGTRTSDILHDIHPETVLRSQLVSQPVLDTAALSNLYVSEPIFKGEQLTLNRFASAAASGIRGEINGSQRLIQVAGGNDQVLAGILHAGDHVDVVASVKFANTQNAVAKTVLTDLLVLQPAVKVTGTTFAGSGNQSTIILAVPDSAVAKLFYVLKNADWSLVLRPTFAKSSLTAPQSATQVLGSAK
jgi:Flp pilus assembly protein CpaB